MTRNGNQVRVLDPVYARPTGAAYYGQRFGCSGGVWACQDLNLGPHPYQGSAPGPVSPGSRLPPARTMHRWRPLRTARLRWRVDQTWTRPSGQGPVQGDRHTAAPQVPVRRSDECFDRVVLRPRSPMVSLAGRRTPWRRPPRSPPAPRAGHGRTGRCPRCQRTSRRRRA
jgi:hypothetical protein